MASKGAVLTFSVIPSKALILVGGSEIYAEGVRIATVCQAVPVDIDCRVEGYACFDRGRCCDEND
jgi:hypothetical protein